MYLTSQIFATISLCLNIFSRFFKKQAHTLLVNIFACLFGLVSCWFLSAYMGMMGLVISTIRAIVFYLFSKNNWEKKLWLLILFVGLQFVSCLLTSILTEFIWWDFVLIFLKGALFAYASWQHNITVFRLFSIISCIVAIIYYLLYLGYMNAFAEFVSIIIVIGVSIVEKLQKKKSILISDKNTDKQLD